MNSVKKLLVPIDFSPESQKALKYASYLAQQINAEIIALHVLQNVTGADGLLPFIMPPEGWPFFGAEPLFRPIDVLLRERALDLWNFIDRNVRDMGPVKIRRLVRLGTLRKEIMTVAREENIDLIVLELRDRFLFRNWANRKLLRLIDKLPYPVLLAPPVNEEKPRSGRRVPVLYSSVPSENPA